MRFIDVLREHRVKYFTEGKYCRPGWIQFYCPFCFGGSNPEKPYCGYCISYNYVNCWRCGSHPVGKTLMELTGLGWRDVKKILDDLDIPYEAKEIRTGSLKMPFGIGPLLKCHGDYLRRRGFKTKELKRLWLIEGLGYDGRRRDSEYTDLSWRIFIPIIYRGKTVSWTTRSLVDKGTRYLSAAEDEEAIPHKTLLYGEDYATTSISVHEGPLDVWAVGPPATATLGIGWTSSQVLRMSRYPRRIICFDNQPEAQLRARRLCSLLEVFPGETINVVLDAKDAAGASAGELRKFRKLFR